MFKAQCFHCKGNRLIPGQEIKIPQNTWDDQKKKKKERKKITEIGLISLKNLAHDKDYMLNN